jgi:hypothetical protein
LLPRAFPQTELVPGPSRLTELQPRASPRTELLPSLPYEQKCYLAGQAQTSFIFFSILIANLLFWVSVPGEA